MNFDLDTEQGMSNAMRWTEQLIATLSDNGTWFVPSSVSFVTINKPTKTARISSMVPDKRLARVLRAMGWTVKEIGWVTR